jgi:competence protein ComEA
MSDAVPEPSDVSEVPGVFELPRPAAPASWRDRLAGWAESLDLSPARLVGGLVLLAALGFAGWRLLAPPASPPEAHLPFVSTPPTGPGAAAGSPGAAGAGAPGADPSGSMPGSTVAADGVVVDVAGAVGKPGVQHLPAGSRVVDAVDEAGGAAPDADLARINLAALLEDGQQVYVPRLGEVGGGAASAPVGGAGTGSGAAGGGPAGGAGQIIDLNRATADELDALPGVGPAIAQAIVDYRDQHGPFATVDDLLDVRGIGEAKLEDIRPRVHV